LTGLAADRRRRSYVDPAYAIADRHVNRSAAIEMALERAASGWGGGVELRRAELESTTDGEHVRQTAGLYARDAMAWSSLTLAPAARLDLASDGEPLYGLRLAAGLDLPGRSNLKLAAGNAYRRPSFDDLFAADRGASIGDPALRPERALEGEIGWHSPLAWPDALWDGEGAFTVTGYARRVEDLIQWTPGPDGRWRPHNVALAIVRGVELELSAPLGVGLARPAALTLAMTALDARNESEEAAVNGRRLPYRPALAGQVEIGLELPFALGFLARWEATGSSYITAANTKRLPGYALLDLTCERALGRRVIGSVAVLNAGDVAAVDVRDYPLPGREWRLGLRLGSARPD
jgi:outer membrane cobalamin receptor